MKNSTRQSKPKSSKKYDEPIIFVSSAFREEHLAQLKGAPLSIHLAYKSYANKEGIAWPSLRTLARVTGYGINAVKNGKRVLIEMGLLTPTEQSRKGGQFERKAFRVNTVARKQVHGTVAPSTVAPSTVAPSTVARKQCQEGIPSEGFPIEGNPSEEAEEAAATSSPSPLQEKTKPQEIHPCWEAVKHHPFGPPKFRQVWERAYDEQPRDLPLSERMEIAIQECQSQSIPVPSLFYRLKRKVEEKETEDSFPGERHLSAAERRAAKIKEVFGERDLSAEDRFFGHDTNDSE